MKAGRLISLTIAALSLAISMVGARAEVDDACLLDWKLAVGAYEVGDKCKWLDPQVEQRLKARETSKRQCTLVKATPAELEYAPVMRTALKAALQDMPCDGEARKFFDSQAALPQ